MTVVRNTSEVCQSAHHIRFAPSAVVFHLADQEVAGFAHPLRVLIVLSSDRKRLEREHGAVGKADSPDNQLIHFAEPKAAYHEPYHEPSCL